MNNELLQQALDALEESVDLVQHAYDADWRHGMPTRKMQLDATLSALTAHRAAIDAIRAHLAAQPAPVPGLGSEWTPCVKLPITVHVRNQRPGEAHVSTREGITPVRPDDLIMRGVAGEEYPIGRELFERTYRIGDAAPVPAVQPIGIADMPSAYPTRAAPPTQPPVALTPLSDEEMALAIFEARVGHSHFKRDGSTAFRIARSAIARFCEVNGITQKGKS